MAPMHPLPIVKFSGNSCSPSFASYLPVGNFKPKPASRISLGSSLVENVIVLR
jgi:hypothetical protein